MDGEGPAADAAGNIYLLTGSGPFSPARKGGPYATPRSKLTPSLTVADDFAPQRTVHLDKKDLDLGSGGGILVPTQPGRAHEQACGGGKDGTLYNVNIASMGHQRKKNPNAQAIVNAAHPIFTSPAYYNGNVYMSRAVGDVLRQYKIENRYALRRPGCRIERDLRLSWRELEHFGRRLERWCVVGAWRTRARERCQASRCTTPTTPRTWAEEPTTATRPELATSRATPSSSPFPRLPTARSTWGRKPA